MSAAGIRSLGELSEMTGINKGTLSKYFRGLQTPTVHVIPPLCKALQISPQELLIGLGIITL